ncbi:hypothetical protein DSO57_1020455 [Entomophthora muscae]|uniref:Uncharacterized protein n=1 Tax=Entomophthora muscae TaxID=34485 RepID=A0ACC2SGH6_9FUNG|nr:hypothetical protein DSO57_1020455 [Entomophthora muscae]
MARGNLGNGYLMFEILDPTTLSYVTPIIINLEERYARDFDLSDYQLPKVLDFICLYQPKYIAGVESYSRCALLAEKRYLVKDCKAPSRTSAGNVFKRDITGFKKSSAAFIVGKTCSLKLCRFSQCKVIVDIAKHELCNVHLSNRFSRMKGQRMEIASSAWGFDVFDPTACGKGKSKEFSQLSTTKGPESFLLESEEMVTIFPSSSHETLTAEELAKQKEHIAKLQDSLAALDNHGGQMIREAIEGSKHWHINLNLLQPEKQNGNAQIPILSKRTSTSLISRDSKSKKMSVGSVSELAKKLLNETSAAPKYKGVSAKRVFDKFEVYQTLSSKEKLVELLKRVDTEDQKKAPSANESLRFTFKD